MHSRSVMTASLVVAVRHDRSRRLNFARYQGFASQMASRLRDAGLGTTRIVEILRLQFARPGRQATDVLLKGFAGIAPDWDEWLVEQGAIARLARATLTLPDTLSFAH